MGLRTHPASALVRVWVLLLAGVAGSVRSLLDQRPSLTLFLLAVAALVVALVVGFVSWWFTTYVIDGEELRIDSGILTKRSRRIPYERLQSVDIAQPFGARIFGLGELRIEMAGGGDSRSRLSFLSMTDARALRRLLLERSRDEGEAAPDPAAIATDDARRGAQVIASVNPLMLVIGTLLSLDFVLAVAFLVLLVAGATIQHQFLASLSLIIPFALWAGGIVMRRVIAQWGFTLSRRRGGLRIERGLLTTVSQTVPFDRVQGLSIRQPIVWRRFGWDRVDVDIAGYAGRDDDEEEGPTSTVLPIGPTEQARHVIAQLLPDTDVDAVPLQRAPRRSAWLAPVGWRFRAAGTDERTFVGRTGWIVRRHDVVLHQKTQSVEVHQGPLQRLLSLATVEVHTPTGPVNATGRDLDARDARRLASTQVERARIARGRL